MIQLIQGPPRSGKSFFAVNYLIKFVQFDELYQEFILDPNVLVISNIEGLKIRHWDLASCLKGRELEDFFSIENFEAIQAKTKKNHIILCIDEAHEIFPQGYRSDKIYNFFAYHGHIGLDVILMTQGIESMSRLFNPLLEYVVCVTQRSKAVAGAFSYTYRDLKGKYLFSKVLKKDKAVFRAYKSFRQDEHNKPKNALLRWAVVVAGFFLVGGFVFYSALGSLKSRSEQAAIAGKAKGASGEKQYLQPVQVNPVPSGSSPVAVLPAVSPAVDPVPDGVAWRVYPVEGFVRVGSELTFIVKGKRIGGARTRNFDQDLLLVEFYGLPIPDALPATVRQAEGIVTGAPGHPAQGVALAEPSGAFPAGG